MSCLTKLRRCVTSVIGIMVGTRKTADNRDPGRQHLAANGRFYHLELEPGQLPEVEDDKLRKYNIVWEKK